MTGPLPTNGQQPPPPHDDAGIAGSVTSQWAEIYPPAGEDLPEAESTEPRSPVSLPGAAATILFGVTAILVVAGSLTPLFEAALPLGTSFPNVSNVLSMDAWHLTSSDTSPGATLPAHTEPAPVPLGFPLLAAAALLAIVVVLRLRAQRRPDGDRFANALGIGAAAYLTGLVFAVGTFEVAWTALRKSVAIGPTVQENIGSGYWLLVTAAVVSVIATFAAYRRAPDPVAEDSVGMAIVEQQEPSADDPVVPPGQPAEWPVVAVIPTDERTNW
ncbi:MAG TPA: hypothetical protein VH333_25325 [Pseudonocardiaceae bacterium]|nr:hypothetical protein [Pseudonocardiaceae bacterium]